MDTLNLGTKELVSFQLDDLLNAVSTLDGITVEQKIITEDEKTQKQDWTAVSQTEGMRVDCLIDTSAWASGDEGNYKLYLRINIPPELPILGPFIIGVS